MKIIVIIVTYNGLNWIDRCITSVINSDVKANILIIDNNSTDSTASYIKTNYRNITLIESKENLGFGKANNIGLKYALENDYDYIYLLNQDAWINENTLGYLIDEIRKNPDYGIISPVQSNASGDLDRNFANCCPIKMLSDFFRGNLNEIYETNEVMAAHWLISRKCLELVGGFSPSFPHYGEDNNFIQRAYIHGLKTGIATGNIVVHDRENRNITKDQIIYREYIKAITDYSNPLKHESLSRIIFWNFIKNSITLKTPKPLRYLFKFLNQLKKLNETKKESIKKQAFLR